MKTLFTILTASICLYTVQSAPIEYTWTATGSGTLGFGVNRDSFTNALFTITATADTDDICSDVEWCEWKWTVAPVEATVFVAGVGSAVFDAEEVGGSEMVYGRTYSSGAVSVGLYQELLGGEDTFDVVNPVFETYDPRTAIGPVSGPLPYPSSMWFATHPHPFTLDHDSVSTVTFEAKLIPEPSAFALLGLGSLALMKMRRGSLRNKKA